MASGQQEDEVQTVTRSSSPKTPQEATIIEEDGANAQNEPILGRISDAVGVKRFLMIELWIFVMGNIIAGTAKSLAQIIAGRLIAGIGGAGLLTLSCIVITLTIVLWFSLRLPRAESHIRSLRDVITKVDIVGMLLLVASLGFFIVSLNSAGQTIPWNSPTIIGLLCASGVAFIAFWVAEKYAKMPIAPTRLFVKWEWRNVPIAFVTRTLLFFHIFANVCCLSLASFVKTEMFPDLLFTRYFLTIKGFSPDLMAMCGTVFLQVIGHSTILASALVIPFLIIAAIASTVCNELCRIYGHVRLFLVGGLLLLPVGLGLMSTLNETSSIGKIVGYSLVAGAGFGSGTQLSMVIAQVGIPADELSTVTAFVGCAPNLGGTLGVAAIGAVINNVFSHSLSTSPVILASERSVNTNDAVHTASLFPAGSAAHTAVVEAYVGAWQKGYWTLLGISGLEILLCFFLRRVELPGIGEKVRQDEVVDEKKSGELAI
ncbi:hypothetical protein VNI00_013546 [Paramarasmius palmivorus]|uniref:Major facilitator superfamily (MFS) profile domain-containing protein n=1 Tax=Paramarasmius palmivorus TaxID=297713 RepID=A0AAW0BVU8_9AGAR